MEDSLSSQAHTAASRCRSRWRCRPRRGLGHLHHSGRQPPRGNVSSEACAKHSASMRGEAGSLLGDHGVIPATAGGALWRIEAGRGPRGRNASAAEVNPGRRRGWEGDFGIQAQPDSSKCPPPALSLSLPPSLPMPRPKWPITDEHRMRAPQPRGGEERRERERERERERGRRGRKESEEKHLQPASASETSC